MVPEAPAAQQSMVLGQETPWSALVVPDVCAAQLVPPLLVVMMVPPAPAAQQEEMDGHVTPWRVLVVPEVCALQLPPLVVATMVALAPAPTAQQVTRLAHETAFS
jgi:hypothetical protein